MTLRKVVGIYMPNKIRLRFAPSPTGFLHMGSLRTILFNYLIAKNLNGKLVLRVEDTDQKREVKGAAKKLLKILNWLDIKFDEGPGIGNRQVQEKYGPYIQSERLDIYKKYAEGLLAKGEAYPCFCSSERLEKMRANQQEKKLPPRYDRACRNLRDEEVKRMLMLGKKYVIRQKMPLEGVIEVHDELRGKIKFNATDLQDHILIKSNGVPTYQFASVVDDHLMDINHVVRGDEWIPSFPKNVLLYKAFNWPLPKFIHLPLVLNKEGGKLSKRQGDVTVEDFKAKGYLGEALINFSILLGWSPYAKASAGQAPEEKNTEIISLKEVIKKFKIKDINISPAIFDIDKLDYINGYYIRHLDLDKLVELCKPYLKKYIDKIKDYRSGNTYIKKVIALEQERLKKLSEIAELTVFFFIDNLKYPVGLLIWKKLTKGQVKENLTLVKEQLEKIPEKNWTNNSIEEGIINFIQAKKGKVGNFLWPMRVALTGQKASPGPFEVAEVLGKSESLKRIKFAINLL